MSAPAKRKEAEEASALFHIAMIQLGAKTLEDSLSLWQDIPPVKSGRATEKWLASAVRYVMRRRMRARDLALAYYRLVRALETGATIALPGQQNPKHIPLSELRREFNAYLHPEPVNPQPQGEERTDFVAEASDELDGKQLTTEDEHDENEDILVEEIDKLEQELAQLDSQAEAEIEQALQALGPNNLDNKLNEIRDDITAAEADAAREDAHKKVGNRQAATSEREAMDGARGTIFHLTQRDKRALGYVRLSRTGTPCGWCAMLISRGLVYRSEKSATYTDGDKYHDNCHCYAMAVFSREQYSESDLFALNRKYAELWPIVTKGLGGDAAITAWRRFIRQEAKTQKPQVAAA